VKTVLCPETLSISGACAMLREMEEQDVISKLGGSSEPGRKCPGRSPAAVYSASGAQKKTPDPYLGLDELRRKLTMAQAVLA
jgi:hypothetical protein